jgi:hypothetical protein
LFLDYQPNRVPLARSIAAVLSRTSGSIKKSPTGKRILSVSFIEDIFTPFQI